MFTLVHKKEKIFKQFNQLNSISNNNGFIYIFTNPLFRNLIKIGLSDDFERRLKDLSSSTAIPFPFECLCAYELEDMKKVEGALHLALSSQRVNPNREFFEIEPETLLPLLDQLGKRADKKEKEIQSELDQNSTETDKKSSENFKRKIRPVFNFKGLGIMKGAELKNQYKPEITAVVLDERKIRLSTGEEGYISPLTKKILLENPSYKVNGLLYWYHEGTLLRDTYNEVYNDRSNN